MKVKIQIPADYESITIGQFKELNECWDKSQDARWRAVQGVRILCKVDTEVATHLTVGTLDKCYEKLSWLMEQRDADHELVPRFHLRGREYGIIPDFTTLTLGEFIDLETHAKQGFFESLHRVMGVLYRPITDSLGDHYEIEAYRPHERKNQEMLLAPMSVALGAMLFFSSIASRLSVDSVSYSEKEPKRRWARSGAGIKRFITWLKGTS